MGSNKITNVDIVNSSGTEAPNKYYADNLVHHSQVKPSLQKDVFSHLMSNVLEWTDLIDGGNSFNMTKISNLLSSKGNFHSYNHKVVYTTFIKNAQGGYKYKMGVQCYPLLLNADYTLCIEILKSDYQLWHKAKVSVDWATSQGLKIEYVSVRKFSHRYLDSKKNPEFMYYHRLIINF